MPFQLEFTRALWLLGLCVVPVLGYYFAYSLVDFTRRQRLASLICRSLVVTLLVLSLAGLTLLQPTKQEFVLFAVDRSLSVGDESQAATEKYLDSALPHAGDRRIAWLPFATDPGTVSAERPKPVPAEKAKLAATSSAAADPKAKPELNPQATNLAAAIEAAAGAMPPAYVPRIVLLSDGNQTSGDALKAALRAQIPITTIPLKTRPDPEVQVSAVVVPAQVREGEPFYVEVVIDSNHDDAGEVQVFRGAHRVVAEKKTFKKGENRFRFQQQITQERLAEYTVKVSGLKQDALLDNNTESGLVFTTGKPRVLLIESDPTLGQHLARALEQEEIQVDVRPKQGMPESLADLQNYELLIVSNVPATDLTQRQMEIARTYVQDLGGGFMMLGGEQSFGLGGYYKTVLEEILPVRSDFEKEKEKPSLGMILVIDKSGSMGGDKIEMAKEAAKSAAELLGPSDKLGVIAFEGDFYWVSELQSAGNKGRIIDDISRIEAGGGTNMYPAMEEAYNALNSASAKLKHVIMLTDGISAPGDFTGMAGTMASARMTVTTVAVGGDADNSVLEEIARIGQGRSYTATDPTTLPQIFAKETMTASKSAINEQPFLPQVIRPTQTLADIDFAQAPFLLGYVVTRPKATCEFILSSEAGDPLLAWWRYGLGTTVAFTSDAKSRWGAEWLTWPGYGKFWSQVVRHAMRKSDAKGIIVQVDQHDRQATVTLDAIDPSGRFLNQAETELALIDPQLGLRKLPVRQTAPGRYVAEFETPQAGAYHLDLSQKQGGKLLYHQARGLHVGYPDELRLKPTNETLLQEIARVSGGQYNPAAADLFPKSDRTAMRPTPLWPYLITFAALLFLLDVALRRIDFSLFSWRPATFARTPQKQTSPFQVRS
ncbi:MAG: VWA domain-containing protein [Planctomycetota bacterium]